MLFVTMRKTTVRVPLSTYNNVVCNYAKDHCESAIEYIYNNVVCNYAKDHCESAIEYI